MFIVSFFTSFRACGKVFLFFVLSFSLLSCGGGGGDDEVAVTEKFCTTEERPLFCSSAEFCCPRGFPFLCESVSSVGGLVCSDLPCVDSSRTLDIDFCGEE